MKKRKVSVPTMPVLGSTPPEVALATLLGTHLKWEGFLSIAMLGAWTSEHLDPADVDRLAQMAQCIDAGMRSVICVLRNKTD